MMAQAVGAGWGCPHCGAPGPLVAAHCPTCQTELASVVAAGRRAGIYLYNQALGAAQAGFYSEGTDLLERGIDLAGKDPAALSLLGLLYHRSGRVVEALAAWGQAGVDNSEFGAVQSETAAIDVLMAYNIALDLAARSQWNAALQALSPLRESPARLAPAFVLLGLCDWALHQYDQAKQAWQRAIELDPSTPGLQVCLSALVAEMALTDQRQALTPAIAAATMSVPVQPRPARTASWVPVVVAILIAATAAGAAYRAVGVQTRLADSARAELSVARAEAESARSEAVQSTAERVKAEQAHAEQAHAEQVTAKRVTSREASALELLAAAVPSQGSGGLDRLVKAIAQAKQDGVVVPAWMDDIVNSNRVVTAVESYFEGYRLFMSGQYVSAISAFDRSLSLTSGIYCSDDAAYLAARSAQILGRHAEAVTWYARVIAEFPQSDYQDDARYFGAMAAEQAGDKAKAIAWYRELLTSFAGSGYDWEAKQSLGRLEF